MNNNEIKEKINDINNEDHIWLIYILIIFASWYSNSLERKYFIYNDTECKNRYRKIMILIFSTLLIVYIYFFMSSMKSINELKTSDSLKKKKLTELSAIGSLFILVSGIIYLYIAYMDEDIDVEIAFN